METYCTITIANGTEEIVKVNYSIIGNEDLEKVRELDTIDKLDWFEVRSITSSDEEIQEEINAEFETFKYDIINQL